METENRLWVAQGQGWQGDCKEEIIEEPATTLGVGHIHCPGGGDAFMGVYICHNGSNC